MFYIEAFISLIHVDTFFKHYDVEISVAGTETNAIVFPVIDSCHTNKMYFIYM